MKKTLKLWILFITAFTSSITANSGYAILSVMKNRYVNKYHWFTEDEMNDYIALAQSAPGPMAVNGAVVVGYQTCGILGAVVSVLGIILPPLIIMTLVTIFYQHIVTNKYVQVFMQGMQAGVCALLLDVIISLFTSVTKDNKSIYPYILIVAGFLYVRYTNLSIFFLALACIVCALIKCLLWDKRKEM